MMVAPYTYTNIEEDLYYHIQLIHSYPPPTLKQNRECLLKGHLTTYVNTHSSMRLRKEYRNNKCCARCSISL